MRIATALVALIGMLMLGSPAPAQEGGASAEGAERPARQRPARNRPARGGAFRTEAYYQRLQRELDLTPAQQTQIKQMLDTHAQAVANLQKKQGDPAERRAKLAKAREENDEAALKKLRAEMGKAAAERTALQDELNGKIKAVLSEDQKKKYEQLVAARGGRRARAGAGAIQAALRQMKLTEAEKATTDAIVAKTRKAAEGKNRAETAELWNKAVEDIKKVLGPKRAEKFDQIRRDPNARARARAAFRGIELTEAQVDKIVKIQAEYRERLNSVLTDEQKAKLRTARTARGGGARVRGDRGAAREGARDRDRARERGRDRERDRTRERGRDRERARSGASATD